MRKTTSRGGIFRLLYRLTSLELLRNRFGLIDLAIFVFAAAAVVLALIPVLLEYFGSDWKTVRAARSTVVERSTP